MPGAVHDTSIPYAQVVLTGDEVDFAAWECWIERDGGVTHYYARGSCPACHAPSQGHIADLESPIESQGAPGKTLAPPPASEPVEIPVACYCGSDHGHHDTTGCGRRWSILCPRQQP